MTDKRNMLKQLAADRAARMAENGRPRLDLRQDEIERSTRTAMRLAQASKSQLEAEHDSSGSVVA